MTQTQKNKPFYKTRVFLFTIIKRAIDIIGSIVLLIVFSIPMLIVSVLIKIGSPGPAIFKQKRVGKDSQPFFMYKFRSMYVGDMDKFLKDKDPALWKNTKRLAGNYP